ncbi:MAG: hypothetical protein ACR2PH_08615, partial [Desulfobulbia bacterium]
MNHRKEPDIKQKCKITYALVILFMLTSCLTGSVNRKIDKTKDKFDKMANSDEVFKPKENTDLGINVDPEEVKKVDGYFPRPETKMSTPEGKEYEAGDLYLAGGIRALNLASAQIAEKLSSNATLSRGQAWFFYVVGGALMIAAVVFFVIVKAPKTAIAFVLGAVSMFLVPTLIDAIHAALQGLIWLFWGFFGICFICIA